MFAPRPRQLDELAKAQVAQANTAEQYNQVAQLQYQIEDMKATITNLKEELLAVYRVAFSR